MTSLELWILDDDFARADRMGEACAWLMLRHVHFRTSRAMIAALESSLVGRVAYHSAAGERWTCAGQTTALIPAVRYSGERMRVLYGSDSHAVVPAAQVRGRNAEEPGVDYGRYVRTAACDAHDAFSFARLPSGPYFLIARARPRSHAAGPNEGVVIMQRIDLAPGPTRVSLPLG